MTTNPSFNSKPTSSSSSSSTPTAQPLGDVQSRVPVEIWQKICRNLYPSQLIRLSKVATVPRLAVCSLSFWPELFILTHEAGKSRLHLLPGLLGSHSHMLYMCAISAQVCEQCFQVTEFTVDRLYKMPLPVVAPSQTRSTKEVKYYGEPIDPSFKVCLCLDCRKDFFEIKPEPISGILRTRMLPYQKLVVKYPRVIEEVPNFDRLFTHRVYPEHIFRAAARTLYGGDVGIEVCSESTEAVETMTLSRLEQYTAYGSATILPLPSNEESTLFNKAN